MEKFTHEIWSSVSDPGWILFPLGLWIRIQEGDSDK